MQFDLNRHFWKGFAGRFIVPTLLLALTSYFYFGYEVRGKQKDIAEQEIASLTRERLQFDQMFNGAVADLMVLREHPGLQARIAGDSAHGLLTLSRAFLAFCSYKRYYDQIRYIDQQGHERLRVDLDDQICHVTPSDRLQDKSGRYYFREAMRLGPDDVYVSPFDLNVENGRIERPFKPMIRLAARVYDQQGDSHGMVVLNFLGQRLLDAVERSARGGVGEAMLLNAEGYWLKGPKPEDEWGFMFPNAASKTFGHSYPRAWKVVSEQVEGQIATAQGLFTFTTIAPLQQSEALPLGVDAPRRPNAALVTPENYYWKLVSFVPASRIAAFTQRLKMRMWIAGTVFVLIWAVVAFILTYTRERERLARRAVVESDAITRDIVESAFDGVVMIDDHGKIRLFNPAAQKMFGYSEEEVLGRNISMLMPEPHSSQHDDYINRYIRTLEPHIIKKPRELEGMHRDGSMFPIELCVGGKEVEGNWRFTGIIRDITERKEMAGKLEEMAMTDGLTGVYNQAYFKHRFDEEFRRATRYDLLLSLMILDIDYFKRINDTYGHLAGDQFLTDFSTQLQAQVREIDILARYGGEEFIVLMPQTDLAGAKVFAERLRHTVEQMQVHFDSQIIQTTVSIGVAVFDPGRDEEPKTLLGRADDALYKAKHGGRNQVAIAEE